MSNIIQVPGNSDPVLVLSASGTGPGSSTFFHNSAAEGSRPSGLFPAVFLFAITDIVGSFSGLQVNLEWSPITPTGSPQFQTIGTWTPLTSPTTFFPCSETGQYRLNCTSFVGGTSFNVYASIAASMPQGSGGSGGGGSVTQGTVPWQDNITQAAGVNLAGQVAGSLPVTIVGGSSSGAQFAMGSAQSSSALGTIALGYDGTDVRGLLVSNTGQLHTIVDSATLGTVAVSLASLPSLASGSALIGGVEIYDGGGVNKLAVNASGQLTVIFPSAQAVTLTSTTITGNVSVVGTKTPADSYANPTDAEDSFALLGGWDATNTKWQRVQVDAATGTLKVDPGTVAVTGTFFQSTQPVSIAAAVDISDRAARLLGVVYGSQAQQLKQTATNFNLQVELATGGALYDARQIRALTSADVVTADQGGAPWSVTFPSAQAVTLTSTTITGTVSDNLTQVAGVALGATAIVNYGSTPPAVAVPAVNAFVTNAGSIGGGTQYADAAASGTHPTGTQLIGWNKGGSTELAITALSLTNAQPIEVAIVDGTGTQITSFGGGSQFAMGSAQSSSALGTIALGYDGTNVRGLLVSTTGQLHTIIDSATLGTVTVAFPASPIVWAEGHAGGIFDAVQGAAAPANLVQVGGVFTSSLPTIGTGDVSAFQIDAKGQLLTDFNYVLGALHAATNPIFSAITDTINGPAKVKPAIGTATQPPTFSTAGAANADPAVTFTLSPNSGVPAIVQKVGTAGTGSQASLATTGLASVTAGNSLIVLVGVGNNGTATVTDTLGNSYSYLGNQLNGSTFQVAIFYATNIKGGANQVTVTPTASVSLAIAVYEVSGLIGVGGGGSTTVNSTANQQGTADGANGASGTSVTPAIPSIGGTSYPNEIAFTVLGIGTANQTPTAFNPWNKDFDLVVGGSPSGLFGLHVFSQPLGSAGQLVSFTSTITSEPWATLGVFFTPPVTAVAGIVGAQGIFDTAAGSSSTLSQYNTTRLHLDNKALLLVDIGGVLGSAMSVSNPLFSSITDGTTKAGVIVGTTALKTDLSSVAGTATVTAAAGVQKVGIVGNANATLDSTIGAATAPTNALATSVVYQTTVPALTAGQAVAQQSDSTGATYVATAGRKATYSAATGATATAGTGVVLQITGSATKTVRITRIHVTGFAATAAEATFKLQRASAAATSGTSAALTAGKADSGDAAATAVVTHWTATGGTAGASVGGPYISDSVWLPSSTFAVAGDTIGHDRVWVFGGAAKELILRGTSDFMTLTCSGTLAASQVWVEWTEE